MYDLFDNLLVHFERQVTPVFGIKKLAGITTLRLNPSQTLMFGFMAVIFVGALLLRLPLAMEPGKSITFLEALFTATSAVCVTGLVVVDTATTYSTFGEIVIISLIQIGGLGIMVFSVIVALLIGKKIGLKERLLVQNSLNQFKLSGIVQLVRLIILTTFVIELAGAIFLAFAFEDSVGWGKAFYFGVFHSISSFNNAGFDLIGNYASLTGYTANIPLNFIVMILIILGGIGFTVNLEMLRIKSIRRWSLNTKVVLTATILLNILAATFFYAIEHDNPKTLAPMPIEQQITASLFAAVSPRTAGYNTLNYTDMNHDSVMMTILLMFVGGASGSTAGGIKITTFFLLLLVVWSFLKQSNELTIYKRRIAPELIIKALSLAMISIIFVLFSIFILKSLEPQIPLLHIVFEAVSAFGTVGLTCGITPSLDDPSRVILMLLMFIGRVGPLTLAFALVRNTGKSKIRYPEEKILIG